MLTVLCCGKVSIKIILHKNDSAITRKLKTCGQNNQQAESVGFQLARYSFCTALYHESDFNIVGCYLDVTRKLEWDSSIET